ncbi:MAG: polysaccharide biosynthesis tyrosine autokinase, partial [Deltaproteobacteria bacterium]|nr:polysaccharide biosynthesis tyrosine autokinase [Deltaproteobacteria bacterium]
GDSARQQVLVTLAQDLSRLQADRAALRSRYQDLHPAIQALDRKISEMKGKIEAEVKSALVSLDAQGREAAKQIQGAEKFLETLPEAEKRLAELTRQARVYQDTFSFMLQKKGELQVTRAGQIGDVWVAEKPYASGGFVKPRPLLNMMLAAIVGLVLGIGLAFFFEYLDDSVKNADDIQTSVQFPVLGTVCRYSFSEDGLPPHHRYLPTQYDPKCQMAEAFRTVRSNLLFTGVDQLHRLILFTSPLPGDGKTTVAVNVAVSLSQLGKRVLLVDADLRKPMIHRIFRANPSPGIVNVLVQEKWEEALAEAIQATEMQHLYVLACGDVPPNPNEMLGSAKMGHLIDALARSYDFVLFDTSPLLAVSDAMVLAQRVRGVLIVARSGETSRTALKDAMNLFSRSQADILGVVLNGVDFRRERYYYRNYYRYSDAC